MPFADFLKALILGLVEGATEFIPVSSTGHLIIAGHFLGFTGEKAAVFEIVIQLGAILAVVWQYRVMLAKTAGSLARDAESQRLVSSLVVAFLPAAVVGLIIHDWITEQLFRPSVVVGSLIAGGIVMLIIERMHPKARATTLTSISLPLALGIGLAQCLSMVPGVSRSGATIMGAMALGVARPAATEFSFLLALPVMVAASALGLFTSRDLLSAADIPLFTVGMITSFVSALVAIRFLLKFVASNSFVGFAWYRIMFGLLLLAGFWQAWWTLA